MRNPYDHEYPPAEWTVEGLAVAFEEPGEDPLPPREDRDAWRAISEDSLVGPLTDRIVAKAEAAREEPMPDLRASVDLAYARGEEGARTTFRNTYTTHGMRMMAFTLAECIEDEGRFLEDALDYAWALCEKTTWTGPSCLWRGRDAETCGDLPRVGATAEGRTIDLRSRVGLQLAELDFLLGDALHPGVRERIREEVERKVIAPYEAREDYWWLDPPTNNWNAVCNTSCLGAALYLEEDPDRLARLTKKAVNSLRHFLNGFDPEGGTAEGVGYWNFGYGYYLMLADLLEARTRGEYSLYDVPVVERISGFPLGAEMSPGRYPPFSDATEDAIVNPYVACRAGRRFDRPALVARGRRVLERDDDPWVNENLDVAVRNLAWSAGTAPIEAPPLPPRSYFRGLQWWIVRADPGNPDGLVVAAKGGDNAEPHNHNDCGSFVVHYRGESLLTDLGSPEYASDYGDPEARYTYLAARSLGHSVPYANGVEQVALETIESGDRGQRWRERNEPDLSEAPRAELLERTEGEDVETLAFDLAEAYPESAELTSMERRFTVERAGEGRLAIEDAAAFSDAGSFESVLVSYVPIEHTGRGLVVTGERGRAHVEIADDRPVEVERIEDGVVAATPGRYTEPTPRDVWRARIQSASGERPSIRLSIEPEPR